MAIAGIQSKIASFYTSGAASASATDPVKQALARANQRIEKEQEQTRVQISAFGQAKSSMAQLQSSAKTASQLNDTTKTPGMDDIKKAVQGLASAFNDVNKSLNAIAPSGSKATGSTTETSARMASFDLKRTLTAGNNGAELQNMGFSLNKEGEISVDTAKLEKAFAANPDRVKQSLAKIGQQFEATASSQLEKNGNIGKTVNALDTKTRSLDAQMARQQEQVMAAQKQIEQNAAKIGNTFATNGISKYQEIFSS